MIFDRPLNRIMPQGEAADYKTYQVLSPRSTHTRPAKCTEVSCAAHANGWVTRLDVSTDLGKRQARYIREHAGRRYTIEHEPTREDPRLVLRFPAGQRCFTEHRVPVGRTPIFRVKGGDWRGNPRGVPAVTRNFDDWIDDFANHQINLRDTIEKRG